MVVRARRWKRRRREGDVHGLRWSDTMRGVPRISGAVIVVVVVVIVVVEKLHVGVEVGNVAEDADTVETKAWVATVLAAFPAAWEPVVFEPSVTASAIYPSVWIGW